MCADSVQMQCMVSDSAILCFSVTEVLYINKYLDKKFYY